MDEHRQITRKGSPPYFARGLARLTRSPWRAVVSARLGGISTGALSNLLPTKSIGRLGASQHDPPAPASNAPSFSVVSSVADSVFGGGASRRARKSHRRGAQHHLPGDRHDLAPRRRRTSPWWSRGLWLERDLPRKRVTRAGARLPGEGRERGTSLVSRHAGACTAVQKLSQPLEWLRSRPSRRVDKRGGGQ